MGFFFLVKTSQTGKNKSRKNLSENNTHNRYTAFGIPHPTVAGGEITELYGVYNSWRGVAPYLRIMVRPFEQRRNKLNLTVSSRMGKSCCRKYIFLLLTPGLIRLCVDYFLTFLIFVHVCEVRYRIFVIIVFVSSLHY